MTQISIGSPNEMPSRVKAWEKQTKHRVDTKLPICLDERPHQTLEIVDSGEFSIIVMAWTKSHTFSVDIIL